MKWYEVLKKHFKQNFGILGQKCSVSYNGNIFYIKKRITPDRYKIMLRNPFGPDKYVSDSSTLNQVISIVKNYNESVLTTNDYTYNISLVNPDLIPSNSGVRLIDEVVNEIELNQQITVNASSFQNAYFPTQGGYYSAIFDPEESEVRVQGQLTSCNCDDCLAEREET